MTRVIAVVLGWGIFLGYMVTILWQHEDHLFAIAGTLVLVVAASMATGSEFGRYLMKSEFGKYGDLAQLEVLRGEEHGRRKRN